MNLPCIVVRGYLWNLIRGRHLRSFYHRISIFCLLLFAIQTGSQADEVNVNSGAQPLPFGPWRTFDFGASIFAVRPDSYNVLSRSLLPHLAGTESNLLRTVIEGGLVQVFLDNNVAGYYRIHTSRNLSTWTSDRVTQFAPSQTIMTLIPGLLLQSQFVKVEWLGSAFHVSRQPTDTTHYLGPPATLSVEATGISLSYQWLKNGRGIKGATNTSLTVPSIEQTDQDTYQVSISYQKYNDQSQLVALVWTSSPTRFIRDPNAPPYIAIQPKSRTVTIGDDVGFDVTALGVGPIKYQWLKDGIEIPKANDNYIRIFGVRLEDAGGYSLTAKNAAGVTTSDPAILTVKPPPPKPRGIYMGKFNGQVDNGGFAVIVPSTGLGALVGYNTTRREGVIGSSFAISDVGTASFVTGQRGTIRATFTTNTVTGTFVSSDNFPGSFSGSKKSDAGIHAANAGLYSGTYSGYLQGTAQGILAADGTVFFYTYNLAFGEDGGGFGTIDENGKMSAMTVPDNLHVTGVLDSITHKITGTYSGGGNVTGTFTMNRVAVP